MGETTTMAQQQATRIVILGAGFGGLYTALHLERLWRRDPAVQITLVSRDNYFTMTPLLFEASSGVLEPRHAVSPVRTMLRRTQFIEGDVQRVDLDRRVVFARHAPDLPVYEVPYDHLVIALGGVTNHRLIPGSESALAFKTLADAIFLRNHVIDCFERADAETDEQRRRELLTFVIVGGGLVGVELMGELRPFVAHLRRSYRHGLPGEFHLLEAAGKILPELDPDLADYAARTLHRRGIHVRTDTIVSRIEPGRVVLSDGSELRADTIVLAAGVSPNPLLESFTLAKGPRGHVAVDATMRSVSHPQVWALGDCAAIPDPSGKPYPPLAQHALRQARVLAGNITAALRGGALKPFVYQSLGTLASLGHYSGVGRVLKFKVRGFAAWWIWRTYYLIQMPRWERRIRIMLDWTVALLFRNDIVKLDLFGHQHPARQRTDRQ